MPGFNLSLLNPVQIPTCSRQHSRDSTTFLALVGKESTAGYETMYSKHNLCKHYYCHQRWDLCAEEWVCLTVGISLCTLLQIVPLAQLQFTHPLSVAVEPTGQCLQGYCGANSRQPHGEVPKIVLVPLIEKHYCGLNRMGRPPPLCLERQSNSFVSKETSLW